MAINNIMMTVKMNRKLQKYLEEQTRQMVADFQRSKASPTYYVIFFFCLSPLTGQGKYIGPTPCTAIC